MKRCLFLACWFSLVGLACADDLTRALQQKLKEQGFYYGEVNGQSSAETTAALRRFQIRYGLRVTGEADVPTRRALGLLDGAAATGPNQKPAATPSPLPRPEERQPFRNPQDQHLPNKPYLAPEQGQRRPDAPHDAQDPRDPYDSFAAPAPPPVAPGLSGPNGTASSFAGTVYERAPRQLQENVLYAVQGLLARRGLYRGELDGRPGPATTEAIALFQRDEGLPETGRLDSETLNELRVLPGQRNGPLVNDGEFPPAAPPERQPVYRGVWIR